MPWDKTVLLVGRSFGADRSIPYYIRAFGRSAEPANNYWIPTILDMSFLEKTDFDIARFDAELLRVTPDIVVFMAEYWQPIGPGGSIDLKEKFVELAQRAKASGAQVVFVAQPPSQTERAISFAMKAKILERIVAEAAKIVDARVAPAGRVWAALPSDQRKDLYQTPSVAASETGLILISLAILAVLDGVAPSEGALSDLGLASETASVILKVWPTLKSPAVD